MYKTNVIFKQTYTNKIQIFYLKCPLLVRASCSCPLRRTHKQTISTFLRKQTTPSKILSNFSHPSGGGEFFMCSFLLNICLTFSKFEFKGHPPKHTTIPLPWRGGFFRRKKTGWLKRTQTKTQNDE